MRTTAMDLTLLALNNVLHVNSQDFSRWLAKPQDSLLYVMLLEVPQIAAMVRYTEDTVRRYFRKKIFHAHATGPDGVSFLSHEGSIRVRFAALQRVRPEVRSLEKLGRAFTSAGDIDDKFILKKLQDGADNDAITEEFVARVRSALTKA